MMNINWAVCWNHDQGSVGGFGTCEVPDIECSIQDSMHFSSESNANYRTQEKKKEILQVVIHVLKKVLPVIGRLITRNIVLHPAQISVCTALKRDLLTSPASASAGSS